MNEGDWHEPETQESITTSSDGVPEGKDHKMVVAPTLSRRPSRRTSTGWAKPGVVRYLEVVL